MLQRISRVTSKGQVTILVEIRRLLGVSAHDEVAFLVEDNQVRLAPATTGVVARTAGMLKSDQPALTVQEEKVAFEEGLAEEAVNEG